MQQMDIKLQESILKLLEIIKINLLKYFHYKGMFNKALHLREMHYIVISVL